MKKNYEVIVEEILVRSINIMAEDEEEAVNIVSEMYSSEQIILDSEDLFEKRIYEANTQIN